MNETNPAMTDCFSGTALKEIVNRLQNELLKEDEKLGTLITTEDGSNGVRVTKDGYVLVIDKSKYYPISKYVLNDKKEYPSYDVLEFFISEAHKRDILVDAWINPYRISNLKDISKLSSDSIYYKFPDSKVTKKGIYLNPIYSSNPLNYIDYYLKYSNTDQCLNGLKDCGFLDSNFIKKLCLPSTFTCPINHIYIDKRRCPYTFKEFVQYEYEKDRDGNFISAYPDKDNHSIDATRYAMEKYANRRGN